MKSTLWLTMAASMLAACFVSIDEGPHRACDDAHPCTRDRVCVASECVDAAPGDGGSDAGVVDAGCGSRGTRTNLITNPSFEDGGVGWLAYHSGGFTITSHAFEGRKGAHLTVPASGPELFGLNDDMGQKWAVVQRRGERLCFSAWVSGDGKQPVTLSAREYDLNAVRRGQVEVTAVPDGGWTQLQFLLTTESDAGQIDIRVMAGDGAFDADLIEVWRL